MPITPLHLPIVWPLWMKARDKFHFVCLSFGAAVPDLEVLWMAPFVSDPGHARGLLHSFYGALTVDVVITLIVAYLFVPPLGRWLRKKARNGGENWHIFAGKDITKAPISPAWAILSALIGTVSHVTLDLFTHKFNPIFYPYHLDKDINWLLFPDDLSLSLIVFYIPLGIILFYYLLKYWTKPGPDKATKA